MVIKIPLTKEQALADKGAAREIIRACLPIEVLKIESELLSKNGKFVRICLNRTVPVKKASPLLDRVEKYSEFTVQADVSYLNKAAVREGHESGEVERKPNPNDIYLSKVLVYNANTGKIRLGFGTVDNPLLTRLIQWKLDGKPVDKESLAADLYARDLAPSEPSNWVTLLPDNIVNVNRFDNPAFELK